MQIQPARHVSPFFQHLETEDDLERALRSAVSNHVRSMEELHSAITRCVGSLRDDGMKCEAALLTIKSCIGQIGKRDELARSRSVPPALMMDQIVRWCISDYYEGTWITT